METANGFVRTTQPAIEKQVHVPPDQKALLLRKGNELFNQGKFDLAERIFVTLKYSDGLIRVGDVWYRAGNYLKAIRLYHQAPAPDRVEKLSKRMAMVVRQLLIESAGDPEYEQ